MKKWEQSRLEDNIHFYFLMYFPRKDIYTISVLALELDASASSYQMWVSTILRFRNFVRKCAQVEERGHISVDSDKWKNSSVWATKQVLNRMPWETRHRKNMMLTELLCTEGTAWKKDTKMGLQIGEIRRNSESSAFKNKRRVETVNILSVCPCSSLHDYNKEWRVSEMCSSWLSLIQSYARLQHEIEVFMP